MSSIEVICVTYKQSGPLSVFVQSFFNQTSDNWKLSIYHDGYDAEFEQFMQHCKEQAPDRINYHCSETRYNDWGHSLREQAIANITGDYVLITNGDNYYVPKYIEFVSEAIAKRVPDVVMYDMIHSHDKPGYRDLPSYSFFKTQYSRYNIDIGAAIVRSELAKQVGWRDKGFAGDATYFEDIKNAKNGDLDIVKLDQALFVHN